MYMCTQALLTTNSCDLAQDHNPGGEGKALNELRQEQGKALDELRQEHLAQRLLVMGQCLQAYQACSLR
jgi:hypothetical protein